MRHSLGFTLLEMLITLVIAATLAAIAYPLYTHHLRATRRTQASVVLVATSAKLAQHYLVNQSYQGVSLAQLGIDPASIKGFYQLELSPLDGDHYYLRANPQGAQTTDPCGSLILTESGKKSVSGSVAVEQCWGNQ